MATRTESLKGRLSVDTSAWSAGLTRARSIFGGFTAAVGAGFGKIGGALKTAIGGFLKLGQSIAKIGLAGLAAGIAATVAGFKQIASLGGELSDVSARTGIAVGDLVILREQFRIAGLDVGKVTESVSRLNRALEDDKKTDFFKSIGLDPVSMQKLGNMEKLNRVLDSIRAKANGNANAARQMMDEIFGKRQGAEMITLLDPNGFAKAEGMVGELATLMEKNADALDDVSDRLFGGFKTKWLQFWAGAIDLALPQLTKLTDWFAALDFTRMGSAIAENLQWGFNVFRDLWKSGELGEYMFSSLLSGVVKTFSVALAMAKLVGAAMFSAQNLDMIKKFFESLAALLGARIERMISDLPVWLGGDIKLGEGLKSERQKKADNLEFQANDMLRQIAKAAPEYAGTTAKEIAAGFQTALGGLDSLKPFLESAANRRNGLVAGTETGRSAFGGDVAPNTLAQILKSPTTPITSDRSDRSMSAYMAREEAAAKAAAEADRRYARDNRLEAQAKEFGEMKTWMQEMTTLNKQIAENTKMEVQ
jgi:hypothetical protein